MSAFSRIWNVVMALIVSGVAVANVFLTGHIPGSPVWAHWIASLGLGSVAFDAWVKAAES